MQFSEEFIKQVIDKADIVQVIGTFIDVKKHGNSYVAVCPFHNDTRPSMSISPTKKLYKCFSCGHGGNVIGFVMDFEKLHFTEAVQKICSICNIELPKGFVTKTKADPNQKLYDLLEVAKKYYMYELSTKEGTKAIEYLTKRNLSSDIIEHFQIGLAPNDNRNIITMLTEKKNFTLEELNKVGITTNNVNIISDRYKNRIMFPVSDAFGRTIGFSGRIYLDEDTNAKYMNSPETILFNKSKLLYHYFEAVEVAKKEKCIYVVEGFMDCISLYKAGIANSVALMGTAFTDYHLKLLKQLNVEIRLLLDNDNAGIIGTEKIIDAIKNTNIKVTVVEPFKDVKDSDEFFNKYGKEKLKEALTKTKNILDYTLDRLIMTDNYSSDSLSKFITSFSWYFNNLNPIDQELICQRINNLKNIGVDNIKRMFLNNKNNNNFINLKQENKNYNKTIKDNYISLLNDYVKKQYKTDVYNIALYNIRCELDLLSLMPSDNALIEDLKNTNFVFNSPFINIIKDLLIDYYEESKERESILKNTTALSQILATIEFKKESIEAKNDNERTKSENDLYKSYDLIKKSIENIFNFKTTTIDKIKILEMKKTIEKNKQTENLLHQDYTDINDKFDLIRKNINVKNNGGKR